MKKGSSTWLWVIIVGLILAVISVYFLLKLEVNVAIVLIQMFGGK